MINEKNFLDQPIKNYWRTSENIWKTKIDQGGDSTTACLQDYNYFKIYYKMIEINFKKH